MNEVAAAYSEWSASYDTGDNRTRDLDGDVTRRWLEGRRFGVTVEAGCGTGKNTGRLASVADEVHALDFSPGMLERARARVTAPHVRFMQADLTEPWPVADRVAGLVTFNLVLEHLDVLPDAFAEAARVLAPGGTLRVSELHPFRQYRGTQARYTAADGALRSIPAFVHHITDYLQAGEHAGCQLVRLDEWWHETDTGDPPRLLTLEFVRS